MGKEWRGFVFLLETEANPDDCRDVLSRCQNHLNIFRSTGSRATIPFPIDGRFQEIYGILHR
jgi:hypothetical protein